MNVTKPTSRPTVRLAGLLCFAVVVLLASGCASGRGSTGSGSRSNDLITADELQNLGHTNVYDAVQAIRPRWLRPCCPNSFMNPTTVQIYLNGVRLGVVDDLKSVSVANVQLIQWFDPIDASSRWGLDHNQGAIVVTIQ